MERSHFMQGVGLGMLAGAAVGILMSPGKDKIKHAAGQAAHAVENKAESFSQAMKN